MSATTLRLIGILVLVTTAVVAVLNLKRVANLGMMWLSPPLLIVGVLSSLWQHERSRLGWATVLASNSRHFHDQFATEGEVRALAAFEILRCCLRQSGYEYWQRDGGIAIHIGTVSAAG